MELNEIKQTIAQAIDMASMAGGFASLNPQAQLKVLSARDALLAYEPPLPKAPKTKDKK